MPIKGTSRFRHGLKIKVSGSGLRQEVKYDVEQQFNKVFRFPSEKDAANKSATLPPIASLFSVPPYEVAALQKTKLELNNVKNRLNNYEISDWHQHTRRRSSLLPILNTLRRRIGAEFVTQAFAKLYECVARFELVPATSKEYYSVHLCEAPGAFITGLNHYLKQHRSDIRWNWFANTLNPYYEGNYLGNMVSDDRFILHTLDSWCFGEDNTGDIMVKQNLHAIVRRSAYFPMINLVTADGSIDCLDVPERQEEQVSQLHLAEAVTAMRILSQGGSIILKMFTFFEHSSVNLLYLLYVCFEELNVFKPCTSKPGNSEVYVVGKGYRKPDGIDVYLERIFDGLSSPASIFDLSDIPEEFVNKVCECTQLFMIYQQDVIEHNIYHYKRKDAFEEDRLCMFKMEMEEQFFRRYKIHRIPRSEAILHGIDLINGWINLNPQDIFGTYNERATANSSVGDVKLKLLQERVFHADKGMPQFRPRCKLSDLPDIAQLTENCVEMLHITSGRAITKLQSSKFAVITYVRLLLDVIEFVNAEREPDVQLTLCTVDRATNTITINVKAYAFIESFDEYEKNLFKTLLELISEFPHQEEETAGCADQLVVENWLLLSQFSVGVLFILKSYVFTQIVCDSASTIRFFGLRPDGIVVLRCLNETLQAEQNRLNADGNSVLGIVPITLLLDGGFYCALLNHNNRQCIRYCDQMLQ